MLGGARLVAPGHRPGGRAGGRGQRGPGQDRRDRLRDAPRDQEVLCVFSAVTPVPGFRPPLSRRPRLPTALVVPRTDDDRTRLLDYYDLGQATYAMALAAADLGIGTGHASVGDQDQARKILGVPAEYDVAFLLGVGYPADRPLRPIAKPSRRPLGEVIHHGRW